MCDGTVLSFVPRAQKRELCYYRCDTCGFVFLARRHIIAKSKEKARYLLHKNDPSDSGYLDFLHSFLAKAFIPYAKPGGRVLDFGSGPSPVLAEILRDKGFQCDRYDPIFARTRSWRKRCYGAILLHEVAEHIRNPGTVFSALAERIDPGGVIAIRSRFLPSMDDFPTWWYRMDSTHVSFFTPDCLIRFFGGKGFSLLVLADPDTIVLRKTD